VPKRMNRSKCRFGGSLTLGAPRNHVLDGSQDQTNPFAAARGDKSEMRPFTKLLRTLVMYSVRLPVRQTHAMYQT